MNFGYHRPTTPRHLRRGLPRIWRAVAIVLVPTQFIAMMPVTMFAQSPSIQVPQPAAAGQPTGVSQRGYFNPPLLRTPTNLVGRVLPALRPVSLAPSFSKLPTDKEIAWARILPERLYPVGGKTTAEENTQLAGTLMEYYQGPRDDNVSMFTAFLQKHPQSPWRASLLENLGTIYRQTGRFTKALDTWQEVWKSNRNETNSQSRAVANRVLGDLADLNAAIGRTDQLQVLLAEADHREIQGSANIADAQRRLKLMLLAPELTFRCGVHALDQILGMQRSSNAATDLTLSHAQATEQGMSLSQLAQLSADVGLNYQMAKREPGASVIVPAVVNWKFSHYGALLRERDGRYFLNDPVVASRRGVWVTRETLDEESSGYFLVPPGSLPHGWRPVGAEEGAAIWGKCMPFGWDPPKCCDTAAGGSSGTGSSGSPAGLAPIAPCNLGPCSGSGSDGSSGDGSSMCCCASNGMAQYNIYLSSAALHVFDTPVAYRLPRGPSVNFTVAYNQDEALNQARGLMGRPSQIENYSNLGTNWTFGWLSCVPKDLSDNQTVTMYAPGGGTYVFTSSGTGTFSPEVRTGAQLAYNSSANKYVETFASGLQRVYTNDDGYGNLFLSMTVDPQGNTNTLLYDSNNGVLRIRYLIDSLEQTNVVDYDLDTNGQPEDIGKITRVTDPFGRTAKFTYDSVGRLATITDAIGITSQFTYGNDENNNNAPTFINSLTTPYGTTTFTSVRDPNGSSGRALTVTDPLGQQEQAMAYLTWDPEQTCGPDNTVPPDFKEAVNLLNDGWGITYFWNKEAMKEAPGDPTRAVKYAFIRSGGENYNGTGHRVSGVAYFRKNPLENPVWTGYGPFTAHDISYETVDQATSVLHPYAFERVLDDGVTVQVYSNEYDNLYGKLTKTIDPVGRVISNVYAANGIDLTEVRQTTGTSNDLLATYAYNSQHLMLTNTDASGQKTIYNYDPNGLMLTSTDPKGEKTSYVYSNSYLIATIDATGTTNTTYTYDLFGRVYTVTDSEGYTVTTDYDNANRPTVITYPDGTYQQMVYNNLDLAATRDRLGRWTLKFYDPLRRVVAVIDPLWRTTQFQYCTCGALENLIDPLGHTTTWSHDLQGRVTRKTYADGTSVGYTYENTTSRLKGMTDAMGQTTIYSNNVDNTPAQISYSNAVVFTAQVSYTYDTNYDRVVTMVDTNGTTTYTYNPTTNTVLGAGKLASVTVPLSNSIATITYGYDQLGRVLNRAIDNVTNSVTYDNLGRVMVVTNALGAFTNKYIGVTARLSTTIYPNGQLLTNTYFGNAGDHRVQEILNQGSGGSTISKFDYTYDSEGEIQTWIQQMGTTNNVYNFDYDAASQLIDATMNGTFATNTYVYAYDAAGNRLSERTKDVVEGATYNNVNELISRTGGGPLRFRGSVNEPISNATVAGNTATLDSGNNFTGYANVNPGNNTVQIKVSDFNGNTAANYYQVTLADGASQVLKYDLNGNLVSITNTTTQTAISNVWDAANRLVAVYSNNTYASLFTYDGMGRRVRQTEMTNGVAKSDNWMLWCGTELCEERDSTGATVSNRFFSEGEQISGTNYFFTRDHLGSIREMTDSSRTVRAEYTYDPWGRRTKTSGNMDADFGFTGHYFHAPSGLHLARYRVYNADLGRWLSRDPIGERGDLNLYGYVDDTPTVLTDPDGLMYRRPPRPPPPPPPPPHSPCDDTKDAQLIRDCAISGDPADVCLGYCTCKYGDTSLVAGCIKNCAAAYAKKCFCNK